MNELQSGLVDMKTFKETCEGKLDINIFRAYEKQQELDRKREERNFILDSRLHNLERVVPTFVDKEEHEQDMKEKANLDNFEELKSMLEQTKQIHLSEQETLMKRLDTLKAEHEEQTKELMEQM